MYIPLKRMPIFDTEAKLSGIPHCVAGLKETNY